MRSLSTRAKKTRLLSPGATLVSSGSVRRPAIGPAHQLLLNLRLRVHRATAQLYDKLGLAEYEAMEAFVLYDVDNPGSIPL